MKQRILALLLGLILITSLTVPALAENRNGVYILDEKEYLSEAEYQFFQIQALELSDMLDMDILYVLTYDQELEVVARSLNLGSRPNQIMLIDNGQDRAFILFGTAEKLTEADVQKLDDAYSLQPTYVEGITAYLSTAEELITELNEAGAFEEKIEPDVKLPRMVDHANLLNGAEKAHLLLLLDEISQRQQLDVVVVTVDSLDGKTPMNYADDFYDNNGYGFGENHDGILLLVSMEDRDWWISTTGYGITAFTDAGLEYIGNRVVPKLSNGRYGKAFEIFAEKCDAFITQARTGEPYDVGNMPKTPFRFGWCLVISVVIGLFTAACVIWYLQRQLETVHAQTDARNYTRSCAPMLTTNKDIYLYSTMSSRPKLKPEDFCQDRSRSSFGGGFSGGSSTHRSSSGRFHGGRGGKF